MKRTHAQSRAPHMLAVAAASVISGVFQLLSGTGQVQVSSMTPGHTMALLWSVLSAGGGLAVLAGAMVRDVALGLQLERVGHTALVFAWVTYLVSLVGVMSAPWWTSTAFWVAALLVVASLFRIVLIVRVIWVAKRATARRERGLT